MERAQEALRMSMAAQKAAADQAEETRKTQDFDSALQAINDDLQKDNLNLIQSATEALKQRLLRIKHERNDNDAKADVIMQRAKVLQVGLKDTLETCHKTIEFSGKALANYFRNVPKTKLNTEIARRFRDFDKDGNGYLDKEELREALAEMGQRPSDEELEVFFTECDKDNNGMIDEAEFGAMVFVKLGLIDVAEMDKDASDRKKKLKQRSPLRGLAQQTSPLRCASAVISPIRRSSVAGIITLPTALPRLDSNQLSPEARQPSFSEGINSLRSASTESGLVGRRRSPLSNALGAASPPPVIDWARKLPRAASQLTRRHSTTDHVAAVPSRDFARNKSSNSFERSKSRTETSKPKAVPLQHSATAVPRRRLPADLDMRG